jgi:hypothetical protein
MDYKDVNFNCLCLHRTVMSTDQICAAREICRLVGELLDGKRAKTTRFLCGIQAGALPSLLISKALKAKTSEMLRKSFFIVGQLFCF